VTPGYAARAALVAAVMASAWVGSRSNFEVEDDLIVMYQGSVDDCVVHSTKQLIRVEGNWASHRAFAVAASKGHVPAVLAIDPLGAILMTTNVIGVIVGALVGEAEVAVGVADGLADSVGVADGLADSVGVADGLADSVGVADGLADSVGVADGFFVAKPVGVAVGAAETGDSETGVADVGAFETGAVEGVPVVGATDLVGDTDLAGASVNGAAETGDLDGLNVLPYFVGVWETGNPVGAAETGAAELGLTD